MSTSLKVVMNYDFPASIIDQIREVAQTEVIYQKDDAAFKEALAEAEIVCGSLPSDNWRELAPHLRWLQNPGAGIDRLLNTSIMAPDSGVIITTAAGVHQYVISEYVFGSMLMFNRSWPTMVELQAKHIWPHTAQEHQEYPLRKQELVDRTLGIVGLGSIGRRIAQVGRAFGMEILASRHSTQAGDSDPDVDRLFSSEQLHEMLSQCDYVVLALPLTKQTKHLIGEAALRAMPAHSYLVNIGRGDIIDEQVLIRALRENWIAGAGLDVTSQEPLPADSPLYDLPNVILTPHISGGHDRYAERLGKLFIENLRRYRAGQPLRNLVDTQKGY
ncbi:MAG TPA: D-2-hydroxyacid dehydrogenase [Ktedonobacteraceae bacterium]|jgi:phosphoglycerate dehydrogenase-like enzyme